jgi:hypothetical protein
MELPTFLIIGAARSGTTSLYDYVRQHPDVYASPVKEPNFFAVEGGPVQHRGPGEEELHWITDLHAYTALFRNAPVGRATGEASTLYLYSSKAPARIQRYVPDVRLVAILRNPVERAYSAFTYLRERGSEPRASFLDALAAEDERVAQNWSHIWHYRRMGLYYEQLSRYYERFGADQIRVFLYEELVDDPGRIVRQLFEHIRVDPAFEARTSVRRNISGEPRYRFLAPILSPNRLTTRLRPLLAGRLDPLVTRIKQRAMVKPPMPEAAMRQLNFFYRSDVERLGDLIGRDLRSWLSPDG